MKERMFRFLKIRLNFNWLTEQQMYYFKISVFYENVESQILTAQHSV